MLAGYLVAGIIIVGPIALAAYLLGRKGWRAEEIAGAVMFTVMGLCAVISLGALLWDWLA